MNYVSLKTLSTGKVSSINEKLALDAVKRFPKQYEIVSGIPNTVVIPKATEKKSVEGVVKENKPKTMRS